MTEVTSGNYASVAKADDNPRAARIALAVERSRIEYRSEHAVKERGVQQGQDKHQLEYAVTALYYRGEHHQALETILQAADFSKPLAGLSRELVDTATRAALACGDVESGVKFAQAGSQFWKAPFVGLAESAADALMAAGQDPLPPLLSAGPHPTIVSRLIHVLSTREEPQVQAFHSTLLGHNQPVDVEKLAEELGDSSYVELLRTILRRLKRGPEEVERSVKDL